MWTVINHDLYVYYVLRWLSPGDGDRIPPERRQGVKIQKCCIHNVIPASKNPTKNATWVVLAFEFDYAVYATVLIAPHEPMFFPHHSSRDNPDGEHKFRFCVECNQHVKNDISFAVQYTNHTFLPIHKHCFDTNHNLFPMAVIEPLLHKHCI